MMKAEDGFEFVSTKTYTHNTGLSCAFRQWRAQSHCRFLHGYALKIRMEFSATDLDSRNWVVDFGGLKNLKGLFEDTFDHKTLIAEDDPLLEDFKRLHDLGAIDIVIVENAGCEAMAKLVFEATEVWLKDAGYGGRVVLDLVEVAEHESNSAIYRRIK